MRIQQFPLLQPLLPTKYLASLAAVDLAQALRYIFICWCITYGEQCPTELQIQAALAAWHKKDVFVVAGTGQGKTLAGILNQILEPGHGFTLVLSPLKCLQSSQAEDLQSVYGLETMIVNEDTPRDSNLWNKKAHNLGQKQPGTARIVIVTPEQFFQTPEGHMTKLGDLVRQKPFKCHIKLVVADEIHQLITQGLPMHGCPAFRPCYGCLDELKTLLGDSCPWMVLTATAPLYMVKSIESHILCPNYISIHVTSNRRNTMYASHCIIGSLKDYNNYLCFLRHPFNIETQPWVIIFIENSEQTVDLARFLDRSLPFEYRNKGIIKHYHSSMSSGYLNLTHEAFISEAGQCKVLVTTSAESTVSSLHVEYLVLTIDRVQLTGQILYGCLVRRPGMKRLVVTFYEPWVSDIELSEYAGGDPLDLDRPHLVPLRAKPSAQEQASLSSVSVLQPNICKCKFFAEYLNDTSVDRLSYVTDHCCDAHNDGFDLQKFLPGPLYVPVAEEAIKKVKSRKRPLKQQEILQVIVTKWLHESYSNNRHFGRQIYHILTHGQIKALVAVPVGDLATKEALLGQSSAWEELWGDSLMAVIVGHDKAQVNKLHKKAERAQEIAE
ncbi:P-loop containing nucleoside triphosphate hydrolase protein [Mycena floridula]|nr:P-loop containing nucleoside triphosphate hydrolase protein [Mycena floridula]